VVCRAGGHYQADTRLGTGAAGDGVSSGFDSGGAMKIETRGPTLMESLEASITRALETRIKEARELAIKEAMEIFEKELRTRVGQVAINLANFYSIERSGVDLLIHVKIEKAGND
jgi:hypothetical protein